MLSKTLMILGASILQLPAIQTAVDMGLNVIALDMNPEAVGFSVKGVTKEVISTTDIPAAVKAAAKHNIDGVMTLATDMPMRTVAAVAEKLHLVGISPQTAINATDKSVMRECLLSAGVPVPKFFKASNEDEFISAVSKFEDSFIVKPCDSSGSRGICLVNDRNDRQAALSAFQRALSFSHNGAVMIEEYMQGPEVSVETITIDGQTHIIQITDKITTGAPRFVELGHTQPSRLSDLTTKNIKSIAEAAISAIGIENGPSHTEIIVTDEGAKIVELGARLGGDCIATHLVPLSTGVNMVEACIKIALGEKPDITKKYSMGSAIRYMPQTPGIIKDIKGTQCAANVQGVQQISFVCGIGSKVSEIDSSNSRIGFIIAQGKNADEAEINCENAIKKICVCME